MQPVDPRIDPKLVPPGSVATLIAKDQPEYLTLPKFQAIAQKFNPCVGCALMDFLYAQPRVGAALADCTAEQHAEIHNGLRAITWKAAELGLLKS